MASRNAVVEGKLAATCKAQISVKMKSIQWLNTVFTGFVLVPEHHHDISRSFNFSEVLLQLITLVLAITWVAKRFAVLAIVSKLLITLIDSLLAIFPVN